MGGRPRTPTKVLELKGAFKKHPERRRERANEPQPMGQLGAPPKNLRKREQAVWDLIAIAAPWLTDADRLFVAHTAMLGALVSMRKASPAEQRLYAVNLGKLGLNPAERSKIQLPGARKKNTAFGEFRA